MPTREDLTGIHPGAAAPSFELKLTPVNPMRPGSAVGFSLDRAGEASLKVYDVQGRELRNLVEGRLSAGPHVTHWDGRDNTGRLLPSGIYFYRLASGDRSETRKAMLVR